MLTRALLREGARAARFGLDPVALQAGTDLAVETALRELSERARPAPSGAHLARVAAHACGGDEQIGSLLADAAARVGADGVVLVEAGEGLHCELEYRDGMHYDRGFVSLELHDRRDGNPCSSFSTLTSCCA